MNKKVCEEYQGIRDEYVLQCICTSLKEEIEKLNNIINEFEKELKWQRKLALALNESFEVSRIDILINRLQRLRGKC